jgi:hypothetical protein
MCSQLSVLAILAVAFAAMATTPGRLVGAHKAGAVLVSWASMAGGWPATRRTRA